MRNSLALITVVTHPRGFRLNRGTWSRMRERARDGFLAWRWRRQRDSNSPKLEALVSRTNAFGSGLEINLRIGIRT